MKFAGSGYDLPKPLWCQGGSSNQPATDANGVVVAPVATGPSPWIKEFPGDTFATKGTPRQSPAVHAVHAYCKVTYDEDDVSAMAASSTPIVWVYAYLWMVRPSWVYASFSDPEVRKAVKILFTQSYWSGSPFTPAIPAPGLPGFLPKTLPTVGVPEMYKFSTNGPPAFQLDIEDVPEYAPTDSCLHGPQDCYFYVEFYLLSRANAAPASGDLVAKRSLRRNTSTRTPNFYIEGGYVRLI